MPAHCNLFEDPLIKCLQPAGVEYWASDRREVAEASSCRRRDPELGRFKALPRLIALVGKLMNNRIFFQHPDLMRLLSVHENVMSIMMNILTAQQGAVEHEGEEVKEKTPIKVTVYLSRYIDFLRFCVWINGENVEENANLVIRLLIRRPECLGVALKGEGQ
ncbi:hypothetical protein OSTOST_24041, partial [Ostertagia ostertagi]